MGLIELLIGAIVAKKWKFSFINWKKKTLNSISRYSISAKFNLFSILIHDANCSVDNAQIATHVTINNLKLIRCQIEFDVHVMYCNSYNIPFFPPLDRNNLFDNGCISRALRFIVEETWTWLWLFSSWTLRLLYAIGFFFSICFAQLDRNSNRLTRRVLTSDSGIPNSPIKYFFLNEPILHLEWEFKSNSWVTFIFSMKFNYHARSHSGSWEVRIKELLATTEWPRPLITLNNKTNEKVQELI